MTLSDGQTRVRHLINQTDSTDTQFDDTNFIAAALNQGRRMFVRILPDSYFPNLKATVAISLTAGAGAFASDHLRTQEGERVLVDSTFANRIDKANMWRLKRLEGNDLTKSANGDKYYWFDDTGVNVLPTSATTCNVPYMKEPADLGVGDNTELPLDVEDLTVDFAFEKCMATKRGDLELALHLARNRGFTVRAMFANTDN